MDFLEQIKQRVAEAEQAAETSNSGDFEEKDFQVLMPKYGTYVFVILPQEKGPNIGVETQYKDNPIQKKQLWAVAMLQIAEKGNSSPLNAYVYKDGATPVDFTSKVAMLNVPNGVSKQLDAKILTAATGSEWVEPRQVYWDKDTPGDAQVYAISLTRSKTGAAPTDVSWDFEVTAKPLSGVYLDQVQKLASLPVDLEEARETFDFFFGPKRAVANQPAASATMDDVDEF